MEVVTVGGGWSGRLPGIADEPLARLLGTCLSPWRPTMQTRDIASNRSEPRPPLKLLGRAALRFDPLPLMRQRPGPHQGAGQKMVSAAGQAVAGLAGLLVCVSAVVPIRDDLPQVVRLKGDGAGVAAIR